MAETQNNLIELTADIVSAHLANNKVSVNEVAELVQQVHGALSGLGQAAPEQAQAKVPVVSVRASVKPDYIVCMECGAKQKTLKRHLQVAHGMTPAQYRADYGLPNSYPMTSPNYSETRSSMAKTIGLGRKLTDAAGKKPKAKRGRKPKAASADA
jgi:predicted transcriptional regulator